MLLRLHFRCQGLISLLQVGKGRAHCLGLLIPALLIDSKEAGEFHALVGAAEDMAGTLRINGNRIIHRICHLGCQKTAPNQLVELILLLGQALCDPLGVQLHVGGTNGFVGILSAGFGLEYVVGAIVIVLSVTVCDKVCRRIHRLIGKAQGVGTHIGDQTQSALTGHVNTFIQLLGDGHGALGSHI